jgi:RNA polymerase sporulation-specific sigma factor
MDDVARCFCVKSFDRPLSADEEREYLLRWRSGDREARNILVERNMRLVAHMVKKYSDPEHDPEDLISVGTIGLIKAINTFDVDKSIRLATYAAKCIDNELLMQLRSEKKHSREISIYEPIGTDKEGNEINLMEVLCACEDDVVGSFALVEDVKRLYGAVRDELDERERMIITRRYGLYGVNPMTQQQMAAMLGISRSYVSRIEKKALEKLYKKLAS